MSFLHILKNFFNMKIEISKNNNYKVLTIQRSELLKNDKKKHCWAYTNPKGPDIKALNDNICIKSARDCLISKENIKFELSNDGEYVFLCFINFSISNISGLDAQVTFETKGNYNYYFKDTLYFSVYNEYLGLELSESKFIYVDNILEANKPIICFNIKSKKNNLGLLTWQYNPCYYRISIEQPFYFIDNEGVKKNSVRELSKLDFSKTLNICLSEINEPIVGHVLKPVVRIEGNNKKWEHPLSNFKLEYSNLKISNIKVLKNNLIIGDSSSLLSFDVSFKANTSNLAPWKYLVNVCKLKINEPFQFVESMSDSIEVRVSYGYYQTFNVRFSTNIASHLIGSELTPQISIKGNQIDEMKYLTPITPIAPPLPKIDLDFIPVLNPLCVCDIISDQKIGSLRITNACTCAFSRDLIVNGINTTNDCISVSKERVSPIKPGEGVEEIDILYHAQSFKDLTEEPFLVNSTIEVNSNVGQEKMDIGFIVTNDTLTKSSDKITIPITPLPQLNIGVSDQIICYDGEEKKEVDLCVSNWHDKPRKNVLLSLEDKKGVASLEVNSFPNITPNVDCELQLLIDVSKLTLNKPTQVVVSAIADYTYKVSKSVTIIKNSKEVAKPKIENFYSENNSIYANGQEYKVSTFEIVNDTKSASEIEAESADITSLDIEISEQDQKDYSTFFRINRPKDLLKPQERVKCTVILKIDREKFHENNVYFYYRPVCDNQANYEETRDLTQYVTINRQLPAERSMITFVPEQNNGYDPNDNHFLIGTIILHKKRENPDSGTYYDRTKERIGIVDKDFFFMDKEGIQINDVQTFGIEQKELRLYWRVKDNVFLDMSLPIHYYCENVPEDNDKLISEIYE